MNYEYGLLNFSADRPVATLHEDLLDRGHFVISLANAVCAWKGSESLVIAIYGPWGSGKSSVKNMVTSLLESRQQSGHNAPTIVEFNPWEWSGENRLLEVFFDEIETALRTKADSPNVEDLSKKWKTYAARLTLGSTALEHMKTAAEVAGMPWIPLVLGTLSTGLKQSVPLSQQAAEVHAMNSEAADESLHTLKSSLHDALRRLPSPVLVVIDDVDRLNAQEIRTLFRLVKVNADFPNMIYLLLFDRHIIEKALDDASGDTGRSYMEKIIQAGFDLPDVRQEALDQTVSSALDDLLGSPAMKRTFDEMRWQHLYANGLRHYCSSLRKVRRFVSSLSFQVGLYIHDSELEVNVIDLIGVEAIRVFEPTLYRTLAGNPHLVFGQSWLSHKRESKEEEIKRLESLVSSVSSTSRSASIGILEELFPQIYWLHKGHGHGLGFENGWLRDLRICHREMFGRFFAMALPPKDISLSVLDSIIKNASDRDLLREHLSNLQANNLLPRTLERLEAYIDRLDLSEAVPFVTALFDIGDSIPSEYEGLFGLGPDMTACRIIHHYLMKDEDRTHRSQTLLTAIGETDGSWLPVRVVAMEGPKLDEEHDEKFIFDSDSFGKAKAICLAKIKTLKDQDRLIGPRLSFYLWRWLQWEGEAGPREWAAGRLSSVGDALKFVEAFVQPIHVGTARGSYVRFELRLSSLGAFVDLDCVRAAVSPVLADHVPEEFQSIVNENQRTVTAIGKAFKRRDEGRSEDDWRHDDDD